MKDIWKTKYPLPWKVYYDCSGTKENPVGIMAANGVAVVIFEDDPGDDYPYEQIVAWANACGDISTNLLLDLDKQVIVIRKNEIYIDNWAISMERDGEYFSRYVAPEHINFSPRLIGNIDHHNRIDDSYTTTSKIVNITDKRCKTSSGSIYLLGKIDPSFEKHLHEKYPYWNGEGIPQRIKDFINKGD